MTTVEVFAPAKVNLTLHITGQREDGYHLLDSLVVFADVGDHLTIRDADVPATPGEKGNLSVVGREAEGVPEGGDNLVARAVGMMVDEVAPWIQIEKNLPIASGLGGGSSDAAAAMRALAALGGVASQHLASEDAPRSLSQALGADVPMCLEARPWRASGIGEVLVPARLPRLEAVLVNPRVPVSTPDVFRALKYRENPAMDWPPDADSVGSLCDWLAKMRNDLEVPACGLVPEIDHVLSRLRQLPGIMLARMSGSGATCFGLFEDKEAAQAGAEVIRWHEPLWWVNAVTLGDMSERARPRVG